MMTQPKKNIQRNKHKKQLKQIKSEKNQKCLITITGVVINYALNGTPQRAITMTNT